MDNTKERPIVLTTQEVNAVLAGSKTQHRSVIIPKVEGVGLRFIDYGKGWQAYETDDSDTTLPSDDLLVKCPFGKVGDRLWVQEFHARREFADPLIGTHYYADGPLTLDLRHDAGLLIKYAAENMPRWASRLVLEITDIRIEHVQDITVINAQAEGSPLQISTTYFASPFHKACGDIMKWFKDYWNNKQSKMSSYEANPLVWAIDFKAVEPSEVQGG